MRELTKKEMIKIIDSELYDFFNKNTKLKFYDGGTALGLQTVIFVRNDKCIGIVTPDTIIELFLKGYKAALKINK